MISTCQERNRLQDIIDNGGNVADEFWLASNLRVAWAERDKLLILLQEARGVLEKYRRQHTYCEDTWYSCPKSEEGCADDEAGSECNCEADKLNAELDIILARISLEGV